MRIASHALLALAAALAAGCASTAAPEASPLDRSFGAAVDRAKAMQVADPDAARKPKPAMQQDGAAAKSTIDLYEKTWQSPPPPTTVLNIGTTGTK